MVSLPIAAEGAERLPRMTLGLRRSAVVETTALLAAALALGIAYGFPDRFDGVSPHPFWLIVILIASCYGAAEGLFAAFLASLVLLLGNIPEQAFNESSADWLLRVTALPVSWSLTAIVLGEIRSGQIRAYDELHGRFSILQARAERIVEAYEECAQANVRLEHRLATQRETLRTLYDAAGSISQPTLEGVMGGAPAFVNHILAPAKFSIFVLKDGWLEATARQGWSSETDLASRFNAASSIFDAVIVRGEHLCAADEAQEAVLDRQGLIAGPLVDTQSGRVFGMLKIEELGNSGLTTATLIDFRMICAWIGRSCGHACLGEGAKDVSASSITEAALPRPAPSPLPTSIAGFVAPGYAAVLTSPSSSLAEAAMHCLLEGLEDETAEANAARRWHRRRKTWVRERHVVN